MSTTLLNPMAGNGTSARRLAAAVNARMDELGMDTAELVRASGVSDNTVRRIRRGEVAQFRLSIKREIARALGWTADSFDRIMRGEDPVVAEQKTSPAGDWLDLSGLSPEDQAFLRGLAEGIRRKTDD